MSKFIVKIKPNLSVKHFDSIIPGDIHLGSKVSRPLPLQEFLSSIKLRRLIHQGDTFDRTDYKKLPKEHLAYLGFVRELEQDGVEVIWIEGNHDTPLGPLLDRFYRKDTQVQQEYVWTVNGRRFVVLHGHIFDQILKKMPITSDLATWVYDFMQQIDNEEQTISAFLKGKAKAIIQLSDILSLEGCIHAATRKANVVICGHTHQMRHNKFGDKGDWIHYFNAGCWTEKRCGIVAVDNNGRTHLHRIKTRRKTPSK